MITVNKYFKPVKRDAEATLTKNGDFYAVTTHPRGMPLHKCVDNYVKERESNESDVEVELLNGTSDGIIANLDANYHKGLGPADVRKNRRRRTHVIEKEPEIISNTTKESDDDNYRIRRLTPVECERLQAFPDDWTKYGKDDELISDTQRYKCIGNAVTTTVITHIINEMFDEVFGDE